MRYGVIAALVVTTLALTVTAASAQKMMRCYDASGNLVITDQAGSAGLKCPNVPDSKSPGDKATSKATPGDLSKARGALEPLRALQSVTRVGVNYQGYLTRLGDTKIAFDQAIQGMGDSPIRATLLDIMGYYKLAGDAWNGKFQGLSPLNYAEGDACPALRELARVRRDLSVEHALAENSVVGAIFSCASDKIAEAEQLIAATGSSR